MHLETLDKRIEERKPQIVRQIGRICGKRYAEAAKPWGGKMMNPENNYMVQPNLKPVKLYKLK